MPFIKTHFEDLLIYEPQVFEDSRGYFFESYNKRVLMEEGLQLDFVQDNIAKSVFGVLRGLHYQTGDLAQAKLVSVIQGKVLDVVVDLRPESSSYGECFSLLLTENNKKQLFIPRGFAHGYSVLSPEAVFYYKCDNYYSREHEAGIKYNDPQLAIDWMLDTADVLLSERDVNHPPFSDHVPVW